MVLVNFWVRSAIRNVYLMIFLGAIKRPTGKCTLGVAANQITFNSLRLDHIKIPSKTVKVDKDIFSLAHAMSVAVEFA